MSPVDMTQQEEDRDGDLEEKGEDNVNIKVSGKAKKNKYLEESAKIT